MRYLTAEQLLLIHSMVIDETGGLHGVRDRGAVEGFVAAPQQSMFGKEAYPSVYEKAAVYARSVIMTHAFLDGNKRTGMVAASVFLENNGYRIITQEREIERFAIRIVTKKLSIATIAAWLKKYSKKIS